MIRSLRLKGTSTFRARICWSVIPIILPLFVLLSIISLRHHKRLVEEQFMKRGQVMTSNLAYSSELGVFAEDRQLLATSMRGVVGDPDVVYVFIYGEDGTLLADGGRQVNEFTNLALELPAEARGRLVPGQEPIARSVAIGGERFVEFLAPIVSEERKTPEELLLGPLDRGQRQVQQGKQRMIGSVRLSLSLRAVEAHTLALLKLWGGLTVIFFAISTVSIYACARRITRPVKRLTDTAEEIAAGRRSVRVDITAPDEIGRLADAFNGMAASLEQHEAALQRKVVEAKTLYEIGQEITAQVALAPTLHLIVERARALLEAEICLLALRQGESETFAFQAYSGTDAEGLLQVRFRAGEGLSGRAVLTAAPMMVNDYLHDYRDSPFLEAVTKAGIRSQIAVPLKARGAVIGVLTVISRAPYKFRQEDQELLSALADHAAIAIENAQLYEQVRQYTEELEAKVDVRTRELQETNLRLEAASHHKSEFLASMSHELRTPLNAVIGFSEVLLEKMFGGLNAKQEEYLNDILSSGQYLLSLINDILDLAKVEAGRLDLELGVVDLRHLLEGSLVMIRERALAHGITLALEVAADVTPVVGDERKVKQILFNLLSNAVKFTPDKGRVGIRATQAGAAVQIAVWDTGVGIAPEDQQRIFEEFQQVGQGLTGKPEGTGLGLALAKKFVELHGGMMWVDSLPDRGSTFTFTLPTAEAAAHTSHPTAQPELVLPQGAAALSPGPLVLIVEDDPKAADLLRIYLTEAGYSVDMARDGAEGLEKVKRLSPDAVILDVLLPQVDGWAFLTQVKADPTTKDVPVIIVSIVDQKGKGFALGAAEYLVKPVQKETLLRTLRAFGLVTKVRTTPVTVLAIDDDPKTIALLVVALEPEGFRVLTASGGEEGLRLAETARPDLIILDLVMPGMNGFEVLDRLAQSPATQTLPVILFTVKQLTAEEKQRVRGRIARLAQKETFNRKDFADMVRDALRRTLGERT